jgi:hypothetical protein
MFKYLVSENGTRRNIDIYPQPKNLRERFALKVLSIFAPRLTAVTFSEKVWKAPDTEAAREEWRQRMQDWKRQRLEDVTVLEMSVNESTGELEI